MTTAQHLDLAAHHLRQAQRAGRATDNPIARASLRRALARLANEQGLDGAERELAQEAADASGRAYDPAKPLLPWSLLTKRDLSVGASGGDKLVGSTVEPAVVAPVPTALARAGAAVLPGLSGNVPLPSETTRPTGTWLVDETSAVAESTPVLAAVTLSPKHLGSYVELARHFLLATAGDEYVRRAMLAAVTAGLDAGHVDGTGADGQPQGLLRKSGIGSASGANLTLSVALDAIGTLKAAAEDDAVITALMPATVWTLLSKRESASGNGYLIQNGLLAGAARVVVSSSVPAQTILLAALDYVALGYWGAGVEVATNPYGSSSAGWKTGIVGYRAMVSTDVGLTRPAALYKLTAIT